MDRTRVRLHGIDAPERDQHQGPTATAALASMVAGSVYLVEVDEDRFGRLVGQLYHSKEGYDINASMVSAGYAWWYERYAPDSQMLETVRSKHSRRRRGCGKTKSLCRRGSGVGEELHKPLTALATVSAIDILALPSGNVPTY